MVISLTARVHNQSYLWRAPISLVIGIVLLTIIVVMLVSQGTEAAPRGGIRIYEDPGFTTANGVVSGNGTESNPYIISDWEISNQRDGVLIEDTTKYFIVRNITINASGTSWPMHLNTVRNGLFENITIFGRDYIQLYMVGCKDITIGNLTIWGDGNVYIRDTVRCKLVDVDMAEGSSFFQLHYSSNIDLIRCNLSGGVAEGFLLSHCNDVGLTECNSSGYVRGVSVIQCNRISVVRCVLKENKDVDLVFDTGGSGHVVSGNMMGPRGLAIPLVTTRGVDNTNTVDGKTLYYLIDQVNVTIDGNAGQVYLANCTNVKVSNLTMGAMHPINIWASAKCEMWNITITGADRAIISLNTEDLTIRDCTINISERDIYDKRGLSLESSWDVTVKDVYIEGFVTYAGLYIAGGKQKGAVAQVINVTTRIRGAPSIILYRTATAIVEGCTIVGGGVQVYEGTVTEILNCTSNGRLLIESGGRGTARGNEVHGVTNYAGIQINLGNGNAISNNVSNCHYGIFVTSNAGTIADNIIRDCYWGLMLSCGNSMVSGNLVYDCEYGASIERNGITIANGTFKDSRAMGIRINGNDAKIINTTITNVSGIGIHSQNVLEPSRKTIVSRCIITNCSIGIRVDGFTASISLNLIIDCNRYGIVMNGATNIAFLNSFTLNNYDHSSQRYKGPQAADNGANQYDNGVVGNYWEDYLGRYPSAATMDGKVWDTPYMLAGGIGRFDKYPLVKDIDISPPQAHAGKDVTVPQNTTVSLDGSASIDNVGIVGHAWTFVYDNQAYNLTGPITKFTFDLPSIYQVVLIVWDGYDNYDRDTKVVTVLDTDPPVPVLETDVAADMADRCYLDATASWDNSGIIEYLWIIDPEGLNITHEGPLFSIIIDEAGKYHGVLRLTDAAGNWVSTNITITIRDVVPPVARAGPDIEVGQRNEMTFDGSQSSDNVAVVTWKWVITMSVGTVTLSGERPTYVFNETGVYTVDLEVSDATGRMATDKMTVTVFDTVAPVAVAGDDWIIDQGDEVPFDGRSSSDAEGIVHHTWSFEYAGETVNLTGDQVVWTFEMAGEYLVVLMVADPRGNWAEDQLTVTVWDITPPRADAGNHRKVGQGEEVVLDGSASVDNVAVTSWEWWIDDISGMVTLMGQTVPYVFETAGDFVVTLVVKDAVELEDYAVITITVLDSEDPVADADEDAYVAMGAEYRFDGTGSVDNVGVASYQWSFRYQGAAEVMTGERPTFRFDKVGEYSITLEVMDARGNTASDIVIVTVMPELVNWSIGPFRNENGEPVTKAKIKIILGGIKHTTKTDKDGMAWIDVKWTDLVSPVNVTVTKDGWKDLVFDMELDAEGNPIGPIPAMVKGTAKDDSSSIGAAFAVIALLTVLVLVRRRVR